MEPHIPPTSIIPKIPVFGKDSNTSAKPATCCTALTYQGYNCIDTNSSHSLYENSNNE